MVSPPSRADFDPGCRRCARIAAFLNEVRGEHPDYHCAPVAPFGDDRSAVLIVGLAPGKHGANATGRPFTGDHAGIMLYDALHRFGYANRSVSTTPGDGLRLEGCRITNAVKCLPPANKPTGAEVNECNRYLRAELEALPRPGVVLALGAIAHRAILKALALRPSVFPFGHGVRCTPAPGLTLLSSYHCSRYNTQTRRLTTEMFDAIFEALDEITNESADAQG